MNAQHQTSNRPRRLPKIVLAAVALPVALYATSVVHDDVTMTNWGKVGTGNTATTYGFAVGINHSASAQRGLAVGHTNTLNASDAMALGYNNTNSGSKSLATGEGNVINWACLNALAVGSLNKVTKTRAYAIGSRIEADQEDCLAVGAYNKIGVTGTAFVVGNGDSLQRRNAFEVYHDGSVIIVDRQGDISMGIYGD